MKPRLTMSAVYVTRCYSIITPESAEYGDVAESGTMSENEPVQFRDLVSMMRHEFREPSDHPARPSSWLSSGYSTDYATGEEREETLHPVRGARNMRYWAKAMRAAGVLR